MFTIKIRYTTGNTFSSSQEEENIDMQWDSIDKAKKALQDIREHWLVHKHLDLRDEEKKNAAMAKALQSTWHIANCQYSMNLQNNDGILEKIDVFWIGYFETLHEATIVFCTDDDDDNEYNVNFDRINWYNWNQ